MKSTFKILSSSFDPATSVLYAELGRSGISLAVLDNNDCFIALVSYSLERNLTEEEICEKLNHYFSTEPLLQLSYSKAHIIWTFAESILIPQELMEVDKSNEMLELVYGDADTGFKRNDFLYKQELHNYYRVPYALDTSLSIALAQPIPTHIYSVMLEKNTDEGNNMYATFYNNRLILMLQKEGKLQAMQNLEYENPDDAAFHLLNACRSFDIAPDKVKLTISGFIDEQSSLYISIHKFFLDMNFAQMPEKFSYADEIKNHPPHFFSHLFSSAACV